MPPKENADINYGNKLEKKSLPLKDLQKSIDKNLCLREFENNHSSCTKGYEAKFLDCI